MFLFVTFFLNFSWLNDFKNYTNFNEKSCFEIISISQIGFLSYSNFFFYKLLSLYISKKELRESFLLLSKL